MKQFLEVVDEDYIKDSASIIIGFYNQNKKLIPYDEREDFEQDIIVEILSLNKTYDKTKSKFSTYAMWGFKTLKQTIITKYTGIKVNYYQYRKNVTSPIKVYTLKE